MLLSTLHGLLTNRQAVQNNDPYKTLISNVFSAPIGKSYGTYTLDVDGLAAFVKTINLPNFVGSFLKKVQLDFLVERFDTAQGDFIIATVQPKFPTNLGAPIISEHYVNSLKGRKFISYLVDGNWTAWKELNCIVKYLANFASADAVPMTINIDPQTITEYFVNIGLGSTVTLVISDKSRIVKPVFVDLATSGSFLSVIWPEGVVWSNPDGSPPLMLGLGERVCVKFELSSENLLVASYDVYKVN